MYQAACARIQSFHAFCEEAVSKLAALEAQQQQSWQGEAAVVSDGEKALWQELFTATPAFLDQLGVVMRAPVEVTRCR